jgi:hypothetical protein
MIELAPELSGMAEIAVSKAFVSVAGSEVGWTCGAISWVGVWTSLGVSEEIGGSLSPSSTSVVVFRVTWSTFAREPVKSRASSSEWI